MKPLRDPEGNELSQLAAACQLDGRNVLEIGCGNGNLTRQYAALPRRVIGIDPAATDIRLAKDAMQGLSSAVAFIRAIGETLPFSSQTFDIALFACSL